LLRDEGEELKRHLEGLTLRMESVIKQLGRAYGTLITGYNLCDIHHMKCGG